MLKIYRDTASPVGLISDQTSLNFRRISSEPRYEQGGVTMLELMIVVVIMAILAAIAMPNFSTWIQNTKIRSAAEAIQNGLQLARVEAVKRNAAIRFQLTTTVDATCALSTASASWIISFDDPTGLCANNLINEAFPISDTANNPAPRIIQKRTAAEGGRSALVTADQASVVFNGMGRPTAAFNIDITNPAGGDCAVAGPMRCLRVVISTAGQIRMCEPSLANTDPRSC